MDAKWNVGDDYFIRLKPIKELAKNLSQEKFEQDLIIKVMQIINGRELPPGSNKTMPVRVHSYGSWETAKMDVMKEIIETLQNKIQGKMNEKISLETNESKIKWAKDLQELSNAMIGLQNVFGMIQEEFDKK